MSTVSEFGTDVTKFEASTTTVIKLSIEKQQFKGQINQFCDREMKICLRRGTKCNDCGAFQGQNNRKKVGVERVTEVN